MKQNNRGSDRKLDWKLVRRLFPYLKKYSWLVFATLLLMLLVDIASVLHPYLVKVGIDENIRNGDLPGLWNTAVILFFVLLGAFIFQMSFSISVQYLGQRMLLDLRLDLFRHMLGLNNDYFDRSPVGKTMTHITNDVEAIRGFISEGVVTVLGEMLKVIFILVAMLVINFKLALLAFISIPLFVFATLFFRKSIRSGFRGVRRANAQINTALVESITGIREIIQYNYKNKSRQTFTEFNRNYLNAFLKVVHAYALYFPIIEIVSNLSMIVILLSAHFMIGISIEVGEIFAFFTYINMFFRPLRQLAEKFNMFQSAMAASERVFKFLDLKASFSSKPGAIRVKRGFSGLISFKDVSFSYNPGNPVLKNMSFVIKPGEKVALVGSTGSGKTTIISLINRLYDISGGSLQIDGNDIRELDLKTLRCHIATIPQDPFIFTGTVAENISMHDPRISRAMVMEAAEQANARSFINNLPDKYDEQLLEEGKKLSTGQRQLLSFARAFVRRPSIIILDEATSSIDSETERMLDAATESLLMNRTSIIIAHRLSTIKRVDRILVLNRGRLVEQGDHLSLMKEKGIYYQLYNAQSFSLM